MNESSFSALTLAHRFISENVRPGDFCIDATAGRGHDTAFLCRQVGTGGKVLAFDIQPEAVESTRALLEQEGLNTIGQVFLDSHANMDAYAVPESVSCITFNFGWLPGGNHKIFTQADSSIEAIEKGLTLLKSDGIMSLCIYYGRDTGFEEKDALLRYFKTIDSRKYSVLVHDFTNRPNCPPIPVFIYKGK